MTKQRKTDFRSLLWKKMPYYIKKMTDIPGSRAYVQGGGGGGLKGERVKEGRKRGGGGRRWIRCKDSNKKKGKKKTIGKTTTINLGQKKNPRKEGSKEDKTKQMLAGKKKNKGIRMKYIVTAMS